MMNIQENTQLITEMLSISDEVISASEDILNTIKKRFWDDNFKKIGDGAILYNGELQKQLWGYNITVYYSVYNFTYKETFEDDVNGIKFINHFESSGPSLEFTLVSFLGQLCPEYSETHIYHELEHCYQWCLNKTNNPRFKSLVNSAYNQAVERLTNSENPNERKVAFLIYYSNPREQDAYAHEYFVQAKQSPSQFINGYTEIDDRYEEYQNYLQWFYLNRNTPQVKKCVDLYRPFGYNENNLFKYFTKGLRRFGQKLNHVEKRVRMTMSGDRIEHNPNDPANIGLSEESIQRIIENVKRRLRERP